MNVYVYKLYTYIIYKALFSRQRLTARFNGAVNGELRATRNRARIYVLRN